MLEPYVNGADHHTGHHLFFNYNYGQFFTFWDKVLGTYRRPSDECDMTKLLKDKLKAA